MGSVWLLNLDAELEMAAKGRYRASAKTAALVRAHRAPLEAALPAGHRVVEAEDPEGSAAGAYGRAYCPTPSALAALRRLGASVDEAPSLDVIRAVNDRAFAHELGATLPGEAFVRDEAALRAQLASAPDFGQGFLLKRRLSMAGRGRRRVTRSLSPADEAFARASLRDDGGLLIEPFVEVTLEVSLHGELGADGGLRLGVPVVQSVDRFGSFLGAARALPGALSPNEALALVSAAERAGAALHAAGYHGLYGVDAFRYRDGAGSAFRPMVELNARMTMALPVGLSLLEPGPGREREPDRLP